MSAPALVAAMRNRDAADQLLAAVAAWYAAHPPTPAGPAASMRVGGPDDPGTRVGWALTARGRAALAVVPAPREPT